MQRRISFLMFYASPVQALEHAGHAGLVMVSVKDISCCPALDHLQLVDIFISIWVPNGTRIFDKWTNKTEVCRLFDLHCSYIQIPSEEAYSLICLHTYILYVSVPFKVLCHSESEVLGRLYTG